MMEVWKILALAGLKIPAIKAHRMSFPEGERDLRFSKDTVEAYLEDVDHSRRVMAEIEESLAVIEAMKEHISD